MGQKLFLMKRCSTTGVRNYDLESSGSPYSGAAWNSLHSGKFLACHVFPGSYRYSSDKVGYQLKERTFRTPNSSYDPRRSSCMTGSVI
ncbi:hypothetical protein TNCV_1036421 [Trichonephila clavipes]|nr:hypothetical protein TNCV_1036421 [Trichonephila clavipes]